MSATRRTAAHRRPAAAAARRCRPRLLPRVPVGGMRGHRACDASLNDIHAVPRGASSHLYTAATVTSAHGSSTFFQPTAWVTSMTVSVSRARHVRPQRVDVQHRAVGRLHQAHGHHVVVACGRHQFVRIELGDGDAPRRLSGERKTGAGEFAWQRRHPAAVGNGGGDQSQRRRTRCPPSPPSRPAHRPTRHNRPGPRGRIRRTRRRPSCRPAMSRRHSCSASNRNCGGNP